MCGKLTCIKNFHILVVSDKVDMFEGFENVMIWNVKLKISFSSVNNFLNFYLYIFITFFFNLWMIKI